MKRIGFFIDTQKMGGAEFILLSLCKFLVKENKEMEPVFLHFDNFELEDLLKKEKIKTYIVPNKNLYKSIKTLPFFCYKFRKFVKSLNIDLLHSHLYGPVTASSLALMCSGIKSVGTLHDTFIVEERPSRIHLLELCSFLGTKLVAVSETMKNSFKKMGWLFYEKNFLSILNGVKPPLDKKKESLEKLKKSLGIKEDEYIFISVGRLVEVKKHHILINALSKSKNLDKIKLLIVGEGEEKKFLESQVKKLNLESRVLFLGFREDVYNFLLISDCFLLASKSEGLSCSISEAMFSSLPIITTDVGGNFELVKDSKNGFLVKEGDVDGFRDKMDFLFSNKDLGRKFGEASRKFSLENLTIDKMLNKYLELYNSLLS